MRTLRRYWGVRGNFNPSFEGSIGKRATDVATLPPMHRVGAVVACVACTVAAVGAADAAMSPRALRSAILKAVSATHSVHYVGVSTVLGARATMVCDVAGDRGVQRVTFSRKGRTGHATIIVVKSTAYIRGDAFALRGYMHLPKSFASHHAGQWISILHTSPVYRLATIDATFKSFIADSVPQHHLSVVSGKIAGRKVRGLRGRASKAGTLTVYVRARGSQLPVERRDVVRGAYPATSRVRMSRWNEPVRVKAPSHAIPLHG